MNKEQSLTKVINEICFPDVNTGRVEITNAFKNRHRELSLEMILKALEELGIEVSEAFFKYGGGHFYLKKDGKEIKGFEYNFCKPFSDLPEETKETLYRLFNIN